MSCVFHLDGYHYKQSPDEDKENTSSDPLATSQASQTSSEQQPPTSKPVQSRFKPAARPPPRVIGSSLPQQVREVSDAIACWLKRFLPAANTMESI